MHKSPNSPEILRIRCKRKNFLTFKRIAVDYDNYEQALEQIMLNHVKYIQSSPENNESMGTYR